MNAVQAYDASDNNKDEATTESFVLPNLSIKIKRVSQILLKKTQEW